MTFLSNYPPALSIARGLVGGHFAVTKFGRSTNVDLTFRDLWDVTGTAIWIAPTAARLHDIKSSSASDSSAGVGARTVRVYGLKTWITAEVSELISLNGVTNVPTVDSYVIINHMEVVTKGATDVNVGDITATAQTDTTVTAQINASEGRTQTSIVGIPTLENAYLTDVHAAIERGATALAGTVKLMVNSEPDIELLNFARRMSLPTTSDGGNYSRVEFGNYLRIDGPAIIKLQADADTVNSTVTAGFNLIRVTE